METGESPVRSRRCERGIFGPLVLLCAKSRPRHWETGKTAESDDARVRRRTLRKLYAIQRSTERSGLVPRNAGTGFEGPP